MGIHFKTNAGCKKKSFKGCLRHSSIYRESRASHRWFRKTKVSGTTRKEETDLYHGRWGVHLGKCPQEAAQFKGRHLALRKKSPVFFIMYVHLLNLVGSFQRSLMDSECVDSLSSIWRNSDSHSPKFTFCPRIPPRSTLWC